MDLDVLIKGCRLQRASAQKELYDSYKDILFGICRRYIKLEADAEDVFIEGFYKIYKNIGSFKGNGSFEGWMKRIMINESLMFLRKRKHFKLSIESDNVQIKMEPTVLNQLQYHDVIKLLEYLPTGYRTVFNLYVVEGYKHREIAELLGISINTSKSQLILAKKRLQTLVKKKLNFKRS
jgi:RNA polymerase sigma-70 factor (ECF subfamily)